MPLLLKDSGLDRWRELIHNASSRMSNLVLPCFRPSCWKFISIPRWTILFEPAQHEEFVTENIFAPILFSPWHSLFENKGKFLGPPAYGTAQIAVSSKFPV